MKFVNRLSDFLGKYMAWIVLAVAAFSLIQPSFFTAVAQIKVAGQSLTNVLLGVIMFGMGMTLELNDFKIVFSRPKDVLIGCLAQFTIMPLGAFLLAKGLNLDSGLAVGLVLLGTCPGGTASNVMTYLAKGDVPLSVGMTMVSTLLAPLLTPLLTYVLAGQWVEVNMLTMLLSIVQVVLVPIAAGVLVHRLTGDAVKQFDKVLVMVSVLSIVTIVGMCVAPNAQRLMTSGLMVIAAVCLHNWLGFGVGWLFARLLGLETAKKRAISIEVGLQNSGLAVGLAGQFANPLCALPAAVATVAHQISGSVLANVYASMPLEKQESRKAMPELEAEAAKA